MGDASVKSINLLGLEPLENKQRHFHLIVGPSGPSILYQSSESEGDKQEWRPVGKAPKETRVLVMDHHRVPAERALLQLLQHLPEVCETEGGLCALPCWLV